MSWRVKVWCVDCLAANKAHVADDPFRPAGCFCGGVDYILAPRREYTDRCKPAVFDTWNEANEAGAALMADNASEPWRYEVEEAP